MQDNRCSSLPPTTYHPTPRYLAPDIYHPTPRYLRPTAWHLPSDIYRLTSTIWLDAAAYHLAPDIYRLPSTIWQDAVPCTSWLYLAIIVPDWMDNAGWIRMQKKVGEMLHFSFSGCLRKIFILFTFFNAQEKAWYFPVYFLLYFSRKCRRGGDWQGCRKRMPQGSKSRLFTN